MLQSWIIQLPNILAVLAVCIIPGLILIYGIAPRMRLIYAVAQAPAWTLGLITLGSFLIDYLPLPWGLTALALLTAATALIPYLIQLIRRKHPTIPQWRNDLGLLILAFFTGLIAIIPIVTAVPANGVVQGGDSSYHYAQLRLIERTGIASPLEANATMSGLNSDPWYYPDAWHALLSVVATPDTVVTTANLMLAVTPILWFISVAALTVAISGRIRIGMWALFAGGIFPIAATRLQIITTLWPFVFGFVILPGTMAAMIAASRTYRFDAKRLTHSAVNAIQIGLFFFLPVVGLIGIHPSTAVPGGFALFFVVVYQLTSAAVRYHRAGDRHRAVRYLFASLVIIALALLVIHGPGPQRNQFRRFPTVDFSSLPTKLFVSTSLYLPDKGLFALSLYALVAAVTVLSAAYLWKQRKRAVVLAWFANWVLVLACYLPLFGFSTVTSLYYNYPSRAMVGAAIFATPMIAITMNAIWVQIEDRMPRPRLRYLVISVLAGISLVSLVTIEPVHKDAREAFFPDPENVRFLANQDEIKMIREAHNVLPRDSYVIGDPAAGAGLLEILSDIPVVWVYPNYPNYAEDDYLLQYFNTIHINGRICHLVNAYGITHFYQDSPRYYNGSFTDEARPGLYGVDTSNGFTEVARSGDAAIYSIDLCKSNPPPIWRYEGPKQCIKGDGTTACPY